MTATEIRAPVFLRRFGRIVDPRASGTHQVDSTHANVGFVKTENPATAQSLQNYDRLMVSDINLGSCHYVPLSILRLRNDLYCVGWGVKLYSLITFHYS